jgi:hypothetical protein
MIEIVLLMVCALVTVVAAAGAGFYLYSKKNKKGDGTGPSPGGSGPASSGSSENVPIQDGGRCRGEWKKGGVLTFYDVNHPSDGKGSVAGLDFKPVEEMYEKENVVSVIDKHWKGDQFKYVDLRFVKTPGAFQDAKLNQTKVFTAKILDYCADDDCGGTKKGCCSSNLKFAKTFAGVDSSKAKLFDVEQQTLKRALGSANWPLAEDAGVMNVEYKICDSFPKSSFTKYKK